MVLLPFLVSACHVWVHAFAHAVCNGWWQLSDLFSEYLILQTFTCQAATCQVMWLHLQVVWCQKLHYIGTDTSPAATAAVYTLFNS